MNKELYESEHKKMCDEMTKRYGAGWDNDRHAKNKIREAAKRSARNLETKAKEEPYCKVVHLPEQEGKVKEGKKTAEVFVN